MASPSVIYLSTDNTGVVKSKIPTKEAAAKVSELLQKNHDEHHIYFNDDGFHNHIAHHLLTLYGLGAPASVIERQYNFNKSYQRPLQPAPEAVVAELEKLDGFKKYLGDRKHYASYLVFFKQEMEAKGWEKVISEYLFNGDERADDLLARMFGGVLHPIIHLGFGVEFAQPAIVAEALAMACTHGNELLPYLLAAEKAAQPHGMTSKTLPELLDEVRADEKLSNAARWDDGQRLQDGVLGRAQDEMVGYASQWSVSPNKLEEKTAEMINTAVYFTAAAQRPPKRTKIDFFFMHCVNASIFWTTFAKVPFLTIGNKVRLLEWKARVDLAEYAAFHCPQLLLEDVTGYVPKDMEAGGGEWHGIFDRMFEKDEDGHAVKLGRAVANAQQASEQFEGQDWCKIKTFMWLKIGSMVIDSVEDAGGEAEDAAWIRGAGFEEAWRDVEVVPRQTSI